jgi:uncharacterized membrane protein
VGQNENSNNQLTGDEWWKKTSPDKWKFWGMVYFNKDDKRLFISGRKPPSSGWTINFGNPYSILVVIGIIALFLYLFICDPFK